MKYLDNKVPIFSLIIALSYVAYISGRVGESIYYGYPISFIWTDLNSLFISLVTNSVVLSFSAFIIYITIKESHTFIRNIFVIIGGFIGAYGFSFERFTENKMDAIVSLITFVLIFACASLLRKVLTDSQKVSNYIMAVIVFILMCMLMGNWWTSLLPVVKNNENEIILASYKDQFIKLRCVEGERRIFLSEMKDSEIKSKSNDILERNWLEGVCKKPR